MQERIRSKLRRRGIVDEGDEAGDHDDNVISMRWLRALHRPDVVRRSKYLVGW